MLKLRQEEYQRLQYQQQLQQQYIKAHELYSSHLLSQGYTRDYVINFMNTYPDQYRQYCMQYLQQITQAQYA